MKRAPENTWAHSITRRRSLPLRRPAFDDGSSAVLSGAPLPHTNISPMAAHLPSQPHPLHMVVCIAKMVKLQNSKPLSLTFCARADIMRIRIKSRRPFTASEVIFSPKRTRRASDSKVPFLGVPRSRRIVVLIGSSSSLVRRPLGFVVHSGSTLLQVRRPCRFVVLIGSSSLQVRRPCRFLVLEGSSSSKVCRPLGFVVHSGSLFTRIRRSCGSSSTRGRVLSRFFAIRAQLWSASFVYCRARHGTSAGTYLYPFAFVSP